MTRAIAACGHNIQHEGKGNNRRISKRVVVFANIQVQFPLLFIIKVVVFLCRAIRNEYAVIFFQFLIRITVEWVALIRYPTDQAGVTLIRAEGTIQLLQR